MNGQADKDQERIEPLPYRETPGRKQCRDTAEAQRDREWTDEREGPC